MYIDRSYGELRVREAGDARTSRGGAAAGSIEGPFLLISYLRLS